MNISVLIFVQMMLVLLIGLIVYVSKKQKNFFLSYNLTLVILCISIAKLFWFLFIFSKDNSTSICQLSKDFYC